MSEKKKMFSCTHDKFIKLGKCGQLYFEHYPSLVDSLGSQTSELSWLELLLIVHEQSTCNLEVSLVT